MSCEDGPALLDGGCPVVEGAFDRDGSAGENWSEVEGRTLELEGAVGDRMLVNDGEGEDE